MGLGRLVNNADALWGHSFIQLRHVLTPSRLFEVQNKKLCVREMMDILDGAVLR